MESKKGDDFSELGLCMRRARAEDKVQEKLSYVCIQKGGKKMYFLAQFI